MNPKEPLDPDKIQRIFELARNEINRQNPDRAIELVRTLGLDGDELGFERLYAEESLVLAEAYAAKGDAVAESFFEEALTRIASLPERDQRLEMRAKEHFAMYLARFTGCLSKARPLFDEAKGLAVGLALGEDAARIQMSIERIELSVDNHPDLQNFRKFKKVAEQGGYTYQEQLAAWLQHKGTLPQSYSQGLRCARKKADAPDYYFKSLLESVRLKSK